MNKSSQNKWQVRGAALVIFLLGFIAGALALNVYHAWARHGGPGDRADQFAQMLDRLQLSAEQRTQVQQIFGDTREQLQALRRESEPRVTAIRQKADERLQQVLTPAQWQQFQQMREELRARGRRGRAGSGAGSQPPGAP
jgi:Spy/CpxP family protein refolding chaperone